MIGRHDDVTAMPPLSETSGDSPIKELPVYAFYENLSTSSLRMNYERNPKNL